MAGAVTDLQAGDHLGAKHGGQRIDSKATDALAESLPVVPAPLVDKIQKGKFADLCDLLQDNILLAKKSASEGGLGAKDAASGQRRKREFTKDEGGLLSWTQCLQFTLLLSVRRTRTD